MAKKSSTRKVKRTLPSHTVTFQTVQEMYKHEFGRLGWMILAKAKGYDSKIRGYKRAINHLIQSIKILMSEYTNPDRLHDLKILLMDCMVLKQHADRL
jgi:secreted Zn-dependent insulinase-like peptidase